MRHLSYENEFSACGFIFTQIKIIFIRMVSHLDALNSEMAYKELVVNIGNIFCTCQVVDEVCAAVLR